MLSLVERTDIPSCIGLWIRFNLIASERFLEIIKQTDNYAICDSPLFSYLKGIYDKYGVRTLLVIDSYPGRPEALGFSPELCNDIGRNSPWLSIVATDKALATAQASKEVDFVFSFEDDISDVESEALFEKLRQHFLKPYRHMAEICFHANSSDFNPSFLTALTTVLHDLQKVLYMDVSIVVDGKLYFTTCETSCLFCLDPVENTIEIIAEFSFTMFGASRFSSVTTYEDELWFIPAHENEIYIYDLKRQQMEHLKFPHDLISCMGKAGKFAPAVRNGEELWLVPKELKKIIRINMKSRSIRLYDRWPVGISFNGKEDFFNDFYSGFFLNEKLYMLASGCSHNIVLDPKTGEMNAWGEKDKNNSYGNYVNGKLYISPRFKESKIKVGIDAVEELDIEVPSELWLGIPEDCKEHRWWYVTETEKFIIFLPYISRNILLLEKGTARLRIVYLPDHDYRNCYIRKDTFSGYAAHDICGEIWITQFRGASIIRLDTNGDFLGVIDLAFPLKELPKKQLRSAEPVKREAEYSLVDWIEKIPSNSTLILEDANESLSEASHPFLRGRDLWKGDVIQKISAVWKARHMLSLFYMHAAGGDIGLYFREQGIKSIAVWGHDEIALQFSMMASKSSYISFLGMYFSTASGPQLLSDMPFSETGVEACKKGSPLEILQGNDSPDCVVFFEDYSFLPESKKFLASLEIMHFSEPALRQANDRFWLKEFRTKIEMQNISFISVSIPDYYKAFSWNENCKKKDDEELRREWIMKENDFDTEEEYQGFIKEMLTVLQVDKSISGHGFFDHDGEYIMIINNRRIIENAPFKTVGRIILAGICTGLDYCHRQDRFMGQLLQDEILKQGMNYSVTCWLRKFNTLRRHVFEEAFQELDFKAGDIIVWIDFSSRIENADIDAYDICSKLYDEMGEDFFYDRSFHLGVEANRLLSEAIVSKLIEIL